MARRKAEAEQEETQDQGALDAPESQPDAVTQEAAEQAAAAVLEGRASVEEASSEVSPTSTSRPPGVNTPRESFPWEAKPLPR